MGLNIAKTIVERMNGRISFETEEGVGSTFTFDLPLWNDPALAAHPQTPEAERVLICEDNPDVANLLTLLLNQAGFGVEVAYDASQAKAKLAQAPYAAMTLDLILPDQDGISLIRDLRNDPETRELPIVVVSAVADLEQSKLLNGESVSIVDWIQKPIDRERLLSAVRVATRRSAHSRPRILHVEDDADVCHIVATVLEDIAEIVEVGSLREARNALKEESFSLVILDVVLPDGNGLDLLSALSSPMPPTPVVIFSAKDIEHRAVEDVAAVLVKSRTTNQRLLDTIQALIR